MLRPPDARQRRACCRDEQMRYYTVEEMQRYPADPADDLPCWDYESDEFEEYATFQDPQMTADSLRNARLTNDFRLVR